MYKLICSILIITIVLGAELQTGVPALLSQIRDLQTLDNSRADQFINLLDLELSQGSKVEEVVEMIKELLDKLKNDQQMEDLEYAHKITTLKLDIEELERILENLSAERSATNTFIQDTTQELKSLSETIENLEVQLEMLNGKEEDLREQRDQEKLNAQHRVQANQKVLAALREVLEKLTQAVFDEQGKAFIQKDEIVAAIKRELGYNNPVALLVELTSKFDVSTVKRIIEKLETIRDAIIAGQQEEDQREQQAQLSFQTMVAELADVRDKLGGDYEEVKSVHTKKSNDKVAAERNLVYLNEDFTTTTQLLQNTRIQKEQYEASYSSRRTKRLAEIRVVQQAYDLVSQHAEKIASQE